MSNPHSSARTIDRPRKFLIPAALVLLGCCVAGAQATGAEAVGSRNPSISNSLPAAWEEAAGLQAVVADTIDTAARIFDSPDYQKQLLVPGRGDQAFLLSLKSKSLDILPKAGLVWTKDYLPVVDPAKAAPGGAFASADGVISFQTDAESWRIQPEPPLIGPVTLAKLRSAKPDYVHAAARYKPDPAAVQALKGVATETEVVVFFGTWCTQCKHYLPHFLRTLDLVDNPKFTVTFYGVNEDETEPRDVIKKYNMAKTPTVIFLQGGQQLGRIEETPEETMEADMVRILKAK
jgi:thiol-disulfide isomerase/thioredoxin